MRRCRRAWPPAPGGLLERLPIPGHRHRRHRRAQAAGPEWTAILPPAGSKWHRLVEVLLATSRLLAPAAPARLRQYFRQRTSSVTRVVRSSEESSLRKRVPSSTSIMAHARRRSMKRATQRRCLYLLLAATPPSAMAKPPLIAGANYRRRRAVANAVRIVLKPSRAVFRSHGRACRKRELSTGDSAPAPRDRRA